MDIPVHGCLHTCSECSRRVLVERGINGSDHDIFVTATCWECLSAQQKETAMKKYRITEPVAQ